MDSLVQQVVNVVLDVLYNLFSGVLAVIPTPPFTFWGLIASILAPASGFPYGLMAPGLAAWGTIAAIRLNIGTIRFLLKGWL